MRDDPEREEGEEIQKIMDEALPEQLDDERLEEQADEEREPGLDAV